MKNTILNLSIAISMLMFVGNLANATTLPIHTEMQSYSIISGAAVNVAAQTELTVIPNVGGHLAALAATTIGANTTVNDVYAGAAVTTGAGSQVEQITAGAAVTIGANGDVGRVVAGAAITLGASATANRITGSPVTYGANSSGPQGPIINGYTGGVITDRDTMSAVMMVIKEKFNMVLNPENHYVNLNTDMSYSTISETTIDDTFYYGVINLQAQSTLTIYGDVTLIVSGPVTLGAGAEIVLAQGATVTWVIDGALNLGADSDFNGVAYVRGAVNGATSDVGAKYGSCANIYAQGAVSVRSIGQTCPIMPTPTLTTQATQATQCKP